MDRRIDLDHAATTPMDPAVLDRYRELAQSFPANPSSLHEPGRRARGVIDDARGQIAAHLGVKAESVRFTAGGTESNNLAIQGMLVQRPGAHLVTTTVEHSSVLNTARYLHERLGHPFTPVAVDHEGRVDPAAVAAAITADTALVSVQWVNNEVGTVQDIATIAAVCHDAGVPLHVDAVQAAGFLDLTLLGGWPVALASFSAHKFHGPRGVGLLMVREGLSPDPLLHGGAQELGLRAGTENTAGIGATALALALAARHRAAAFSRLRRLGLLLWDLLNASVDGLRLHGPPMDSPHRSPVHLNVGFAGVRGEGVVVNLDFEGISAGTGSACASGAVRPSHVLTAMGLAEADNFSAVRFSPGRNTTEDDVRLAAAATVSVVRDLRTLATP